MTSSSGRSRMLMDGWCVSIPMRWRQWQWWRATSTRTFIGITTTFADVVSLMMGVCCTVGRRKMISATTIYCRMVHQLAALVNAR